VGRKAPPVFVFEIHGRGTLPTLLPVLLVVSWLSLNKWSLFQSVDLFCPPFPPSNTRTYVPMRVGSPLFLPPPWKSYHLLLPIHFPSGSFPGSMANQSCQLVYFIQYLTPHTNRNRSGNDRQTRGKPHHLEVSLSHQIAMTRFISFLLPSRSRNPSPQVGSGPRPTQRSSGPPSPHCIAVPKPRSSGPVSGGPFKSFPSEPPTTK